MLEVVDSSNIFEEQQEKLMDSLDSPDAEDLLQELSMLSEDDVLLKATVESLSTGRLTPLIKEELRCRIQSRRLSEGKAELTVQFDEPDFLQVCTFVSLV